jgi:hypothetical protein
MKRLLGLLILAFTATLAAAQSAGPDNFYGAGLSYNAGASPAIAGTGLYAHKIADSGTYAFTVVDALPTTLRPFVVNTNFSVGVAQKVASFGSVPIFVPTAAGVSYNGANTGWAWSTGGMAVIKLKHDIAIMPNVRLVKSSVSNGTGYQPVVGVLFGWGK